MLPMLWYMLWYMLRSAACAMLLLLLFDEVVGDEYAASSHYGHVRVAVCGVRRARARRDVHAAHLVPNDRLATWRVDWNEDWDATRLRHVATAHRNSPWPH